MIYSDIKSLPSCEPMKPDKLCAFKNHGPGIGQTYPFQKGEIRKKGEQVPCGKAALSSGPIKAAASTPRSWWQELDPLKLRTPPHLPDLYSLVPLWEWQPC